MSNSSKYASLGCVASREGELGVRGEQPPGSQEAFPLSVPSSLLTLANTVGAAATAPGQRLHPGSSDPRLGQKLLLPAPAQRRLRGAAAPSAHSQQAFFTYAFTNPFRWCQIGYSRWVHPAGRAMLPMGGEMSSCFPRNGGRWYCCVFSSVAEHLPAGIWPEFWERSWVRSRQLFQPPAPAGSTCSPAAGAFRLQQSCGKA